MKKIVIVLISFLLLAIGCAESLKEKPVLIEELTFSWSSSLPYEEVITIESDGRIFWKNREVKTDDDFRKVMLALISGCLERNDDLKDKKYNQL